MEQSLIQAYVHIIYSTKHRQELIDTAIESELYSYLGGICNNLDSIPVKIGGYRDHVHVLCALSRKVSVAKLVEALKGHSSKWIKNVNARYNHFYWQNGYGAFSVSPSEVEVLSHYIEHQHVHHKSRTFQEEYRATLQAHDINFDERYVWD